jgi:hypothetical protein
MPVKKERVVPAPFCVDESGLKKDKLEFSGVINPFV